MLTQAQKTVRSNVRNFLIIATLPELQREFNLSLERNDHFRAKCVRELIDEEYNSSKQLVNQPLLGGWF